MRKKRALVIGPTPPPIGGDTVSTRRLLASRYWNEFGIEPLHVNTAAGDRVRVAGERLGARDIARGVSIFMRAVSRLSRIDVVLLWANSRFLCTAGVPIIHAARLWRRPVVVKFFGASLTGFIHDLPGPWRRIVLRTIRAVDILFPQTERFAAELVGELGLEAEHVVCLPNYLPDRMLEGTYRDRRFNGKCLFIGQVKREKGIFDIIEALAGRSDFTCDFYGPVLDRDRAEFFETISGEPNIRYRGVAEPGEMQPILDGYDLLLLPTYHAGEGYPAAVLEAFAAGVPVVATDWKAVPDLVADGERGFIVPIRSPTAISEARPRPPNDGARCGVVSPNALEYARAYTERAVVRDILLRHVRLRIAGGT